MNDPSPVGPEFETAEEAEAYLRWLRAQVAESLADDRPTIDHDEAMRRVRTIIKAKARSSNTIFEYQRANGHSSLSIP
jgi:hypothetical protein